MEIIPAPEKPLAPLPKSQIKRLIAHTIRKAGRQELYVECMNKKMPYKDYLAIMLWDAVTMGEFFTADGRKMQVNEFKDWLDLVKFVSQHIDGPAIIENNSMTQNINVYKIYNNIDESKV